MQYEETSPIWFATLLQRKQMNSESTISEFCCRDLLFEMGKCLFHLFTDSLTLQLCILYQLSHPPCPSAIWHRPWVWKMGRDGVKKTTFLSSGKLFYYMTILINSCLINTPLSIRTLKIYLLGIKICEISDDPGKFTTHQISARKHSTDSFSLSVITDSDRQAFNTTAFIVCSSKEIKVTCIVSSNLENQNRETSYQGHWESSWAFLFCFFFSFWWM